MKRFLALIIIVFISSCSNLPKLIQENPGCWSAFSIMPMGNGWSEIRNINSDSKIDTKSYPTWYKENKALFDGCNTVYYNPYFESFIGIKYGCEDYEYSEKLKKADEITFERHCLIEKSKSLDSPNYDYYYAIPQDLISENKFESEISFSVYEKSTQRQMRRAFESAMHEESFGSIPSFHKLTIFGNYNHGKAAFLQLSLLTKRSEPAMNHFKSLVGSVTFPKR